MSCASFSFILSDEQSHSDADIRNDRSKAESARAMAEVSVERQTKLVDELSRRVSLVSTMRLLNHRVLKRFSYRWAN